ncbi:hypothetical protein [Streptomyces sp. HNM0574]|uniref:hypothetical protein n=1 Tax=Streptomyces sp. HNM0574 TaxID=2714954 RepID=UPI00146E4E1E|nr:hypothetical protein [Streptomyces sp. HNM0574]NLU66638.1 hypothetical protein [Streptomyces sp. HNM0574]
MMIRRGTVPRSATTAVAVAAGLVLTLAGCSSDDSGGGQSRTPNPAGQDGKDEAGAGPDDSTPLAEVKGGDGITLTVDSATREKGGFVTVSGTVTNGSGSTWVAPGWQGDESELAKNSSSMAGAKLVDKEGKKRYFILRDTEGRCLCTKFSTGFQPGDKKPWYAQFPAPPEDRNQVDFQIGDMPPANFKISEE